MPAPAPEGRLPVLPGLALLGVAALGLAMLAPLGTAGLPAAGRLLFWAALLFAATWQGLQWFRRVPPLLPASRAALPVLFVGGSALTMVLLPLEYGLLAWASGLDPVLRLSLHAGAQAWRGSATSANVDRARTGVVLAAIGVPYEDYVSGPSPVTPRAVGVLNFTSGVERNDTTIRTAFRVANRILPDNILS